MNCACYRRVIAALALGFVLAGPAAAKMPSLQYINIAPLPGAGIALNPNGDPDGQGAFQINIPVAYTPQFGYVSMSAYDGRFPNAPGQETANFSGIFAASVWSKPAIYFSAMQVSHVWSEAKALSGQINILTENAQRPSISLGMQDVLEKEQDNRSPYAVVTKKFGLCRQDLFTTLGYGTGRFLNVPFAGVSAPLGRSFNAALEWDGYQFNVGAGFRPGGRRGWLTILGAYNGKTGFLVGAAAAYRFGPRK